MQHTYLALHHTHTAMQHLYGFTEYMQYVCGKYSGMRQIFRNAANMKARSKYEGTQQICRHGLIIKNKSVSEIETDEICSAPGRWHG
jgi:hypothetical protein